jgi:signal transduction histidine kinase
VFVDEYIGVELFRILQEALSNVIRHAKASEVKVSLMKQDNILELNIADNGIGIDEKEIVDINSLGLLGIHERVRSINGSIVINGKKNIGTEISVKVKLYQGK